MTEIINLNKNRKAKARTDKEKKAAENRIKFGRTKEEKNAQKLKAERLERHLKGHKRETEEEK